MCGGVRAQGLYGIARVPARLVRLPCRMIGRYKFGIGQEVVPAGRLCARDRQVHSTSVKQGVTVGICAKCKDSSTMLVTSNPSAEWRVPENAPVSPNCVE